LVVGHDHGSVLLSHLGIKVFRSAPWAEGFPRAGEDGDIQEVVFGEVISDCPELMV